MNEALRILRRVGAIITHDHFVGNSGLHFDTYINKDALFPHTEETSAIGKLFAEKYKDKNIGVVVAPALGGIILSQWTASHLTALSGEKVLGVYTQKTSEDEQILTRGYENLVKDKRILIIEGTTTTGSSVMKVVDVVQQAGGKVIGVCVMVNTDPDGINSKTLGVPFESLCELKVIKYYAKDCPMCKSGMAINTSVGHGKKLEKK